MRSALQGTENFSTHPVDIGQRTEAIVLAELVRRGHKVLVPFGANQRYDLVLDLSGRFLRIQCKTGRLQNGVIRFSACSVRSNTANAYKRSYQGEVDALFVYCPETDRVYAVPIEDATTSEGSLRVDPPANRQSKRIRWATDYELPA